MSNLYLFKTKIKHKAYLTFGEKKIQCFVGGGGIGKKVREGDMITPRGVFKLLEVFYRSSRVSSFYTNLPKRRLKKPPCGALILRAHSTIHTSRVLKHLNVKSFLEMILSMIFLLI